MPPPRLPYRWNARAFSYVSPTSGKFVRTRDVLNAVDRARTAAGEEMRRLSEQLRAGTITLPDWQLGMARQLRDVHRYSAAIAKGGFGQMGPADNGRMGRALRDQYEYLRKFAGQIEQGAAPLDGVFMRRVELYGLSGRSTFHVIERREMDLRGFDEERNERHASDSCEGCLEAEAAGWVPIGELVPPGSRDCLGRCQCGISYRNSSTGDSREAA